VLQCSATDVLYSPLSERVSFTILTLRTHLCICTGLLFPWLVSSKSRKLILVSFNYAHVVDLSVESNILLYFILNRMLKKNFFLQMVSSLDVDICS